jgi:hypothetical protein
MAARTFYRIVKSDPPTVEDFLSYKALGVPAPRDPQRLALWDGISVYATEAQARSLVRHVPALGGYVAQLIVPDDLGLRIERTGPGRGHHTIWADPALLLTTVGTVRR